MITRLVISYASTQEEKTVFIVPYLYFALKNLWNMQTLTQFTLTVFGEKSVIVLQQLEDLKQNGWITVEGHGTCQWQTRIIWLLTQPWQA